MAAKTTIQGPIFKMGFIITDFLIKNWERISDSYTYF